MIDEGMKIEVYHTAPSRSDRVLWAINELGLENITTVKLVKLASLLEGDHVVEEMKKVNPMRQIPTVKLTTSDGKTHIMTESCAIPMFLSEICEDKLSPPKTDILSRATYHRVNMMTSSSIDQMVVAVFFNEVLAPEEMKDMKNAAKGRADFKNKGAVAIKQILGDSQYICGPCHDEFTMADINLAWILFLANKVNMLDDEPKLKEYMERCLDRPSWAKVRENDA